MKNKIKDNRGFVLLFAVSLASILLAIALGVSNIASKEIKFGTSARDTSSAFFAADTGVECTVYHDKISTTVFPASGQETTIDCAGETIPINFSTTPNGGMYDFVIPNLGVDGEGCAKVVVDKDDTTDPSFVKTTITSKGYNIGDVECEGSQNNRVERELLVTYTVGNPTPPDDIGTGFPRVIGSAQSRSNGTQRTHTVNLPATVNEGDLLLVFFSIDGVGTPVWPSGWTQMFRDSENGGNILVTTFEGRYKVATSAEAGTNKTITLTTSNFEVTAHQSLAITDYVGTPVAGSDDGSGATEDPNPPLLSPGWGLNKTLWIAAVGRGAGTTHSPPGEYTNYVSQSSGANFDITRVETARREREALNENPGFFNVSNSGGDAWIAATVGIRGQP